MATSIVGLNQIATMDWENATDECIKSVEHFIEHRCTSLESACEALHLMQYHAYGVDDPVTPMDACAYLDECGIDPKCFLATCGV